MKYRIVEHTEVTSNIDTYLHDIRAEIQTAVPTVSADYDSWMYLEDTLNFGVIPLPVSPGVEPVLLMIERVSALLEPPEKACPYYHQCNSSVQIENVW